MPARRLRTHATRFLAVAATLLLAGWLIGHPWLVTLLGAAAYLAWLLYNMVRLQSWLGDSALDTPDSLGMWRDIFDHIDHLQKFNREQDRKYQAVIEEFRSMTDAFPDATLVVDADDCITWFNDAARQLLGLRVPEDLGQTVTNLVRDPDFANWMAVEGKVRSPFEMTSPLDPNVRLTVNAVRYRGDQRLLILRDVTEVHNLERVRRDFVANVSHELRTPLTVLLGYLESVREECAQNLRPALDRMQEQTGQMQALLDDLLELSRLQNGREIPVEQEVDVPAMVQQLKEQAEELSQGSHRLDFDIDPGAWLQGSAPDLESAFRNLINNAINYTPDGGRIRVTWQATGSGAEFSVQDNGIGIPKRDIPRLTERFYRVGSDRSRQSGGTGLGLAIVKHVLNSHEARLVVDSELGTGSTFSCRFPDARTVMVHGERTSAGH